MRVTEADATMLKLEALAEDINNGRIALPDFQRDFDWSERDIRALLATVLKGWPAGSLLVMRGQSDWFRVRAFDSAPPLASTTRLVVLDGQQRLTSIYRALWNVGPYVYAIDMDQLEGGDIDNLEESVIGVRRKAWDAQYGDLVSQRDKKIIPFYVLRSPSDYFEWRDRVAATASGAAREKLSERLSDVYRSTLTRINVYEFPAVVLENNLESAAIARIFERVNKLGMRLGAFDLMVARAYGPSWNLREQWRAAVDRYEHVARFLVDDGMPVLQTMALVALANVRQSAVLSMPPETVRDQWEAAASATNKALAFLVERCGVVDPTWLPYRAMIVPIAGLCLKGHDLSQYETVLVRWFWDRAFNATYEMATNTRVVTDYKELMDFIGSGKDITVSAPQISTVTEATRRGQGGLWRAFLCAMASSASRDIGGVEIHTGAVESTSTSGGLEVRSLFAGYEEHADGKSDAPPFRLRALGMVILSRRTAAAIKERSLKKVLFESREQPWFAEALEKLFLPDVDDLDALDSEPGRFLQHRAQKLSKFLQSKTGVEMR